MRPLVFLSGLIYLALTLISALLVSVGGVVTCWESCDYDDSGANWWNRNDAWQWDVMLWLGPACALTGVVALALHAARRRGRWPMLGLHGALLAVAGRLLAEAQAFSWVPWWVLIVGSGAAFAVIRRRLARA
jgi:hypothetical protein